MEGLMMPANDNAMSDSEWSHIELSSATVTEAYIEDAKGKRHLLTEIGQFRFFIDAVEKDGGRLGLDSCADYEDAIRRAEQARVDFEIDHPVLDKVVGAR
jgi:hypothetical protein